MLRALRDKRILITREENQSKPFADLVADLGGVPIVIPLLKITCRHYKGDPHLLEQLSNYQWIIFTSANGVHCFFEEFNSKTLNDTVKFAVVGHKTEMALKQYGTTASFVPSVYNAEVMAMEYMQEITINGPLLIVKGSRSRMVIQQAFSENDLAFDELVMYETTSNTENHLLLNNTLKQGSPDFITFTSPSTVEAFMECGCDRQVQQAQQLPCVCIGSTTEERARELGFVQILVPNQFTIEGMVEKIAHYIKEKG
ncbi:uroporphyrinogen-III synthase [Virgibacillus phasianinus]|uniref:Uroporphyrinogen-III synthase n=1 Tax=Virgibacillus phasianinus TaxID=2017483 RepID=A0A220U5R0_9BACI|nr:uroporphyrinogen-III synthase [Virgibacillus phasianinus]ASK63053.1 uroporphyrinogen-III synthase [Virgibacillus phasianinus]